MRNTTLPIHSVTGLRALGWTRRGPIWPVLGGSGEGDGGTGDDSGTDDQGDDDGGSGDDNQDDDSKTKDDKDDKDDDKSKGKTFDEKYVKGLRDEAASSRTQMKALTDAIMSVLNPDGKKGEKPDPAKLAEQLATKDTDLRETKVENAVLKAAPKHSADAGALTDSREFMRKVNALDPSADNFSTKVADAIKKAVADNPSRYGAQAPGRSGGQINNGKTTTGDDSKLRGIDRLRHAYETTGSK